MSVKINNEISNRGITRLCHFTRSSKALHILSSEDGVIAVDFLEKDIYEPNDTGRFDGKTDYINCSIQYPNHWYWKKVRDKDPLFNSWVILLIDPKLMLEEDALFCFTNAAEARGAYIKSGYEGFSEIFAQQVGGKYSRNRTANMLACCPTNDQAEVLIYKSISRKDIIGVAVATKEQAYQEKVRWSLLGGIPDIDIIIAPEMFSGEWSNNVRNGKGTKEDIYRGE